jgi:hypothetical protein
VQEGVPEEGAVRDEEEEGVGETSLDELLARRAEEKDEEEDESLLDLAAEERPETLPTKVLPQQSNEFTCRSCFLVKHKSQLADRKRMICRDCAR